MRRYQYSSSTLPLSSYVIAKVVEKETSGNIWNYRLKLHKSIKVKTASLTNNTQKTSRNQLVMQVDPDFTIGDIVEINRNNEIILHASPGSNDNTLLVNNHCNVSCINCPQITNEYIDGLPEKNLQIISFLDDSFTTIALSGGEPTLDIEYLCKLIENIRRKNEYIQLDILTNGIALAHTGDLIHLMSKLPTNTRFIIALYADYPSLHDRMTNVIGSFYDTITSIHTIASFHRLIELRFIINKLNFMRLPQFIDFAYQHFPYVHQISLIGMEYSGSAYNNSEILFVKQREYSSFLVEAIGKAKQRELPILIYNHQLCHVPAMLWKYCVPTISEWKTLYLKGCVSCLIKGMCGGFFGTTHIELLERDIEPITVELIERIGYEENQG